MSKSQKTPKIGATPTPEKKPIYQDPCVEGHPLAWRFSGCDREGPFGWAIQPDSKYREVIEKLHEFEGKTWAEILDTGSHPIETHKLSNEARERLVSLKRDDLDELVSFRLSGPNRVWCDQNGHIMRVLWWDPNHQVYPTLKDKGDRKKARRRNNQ